MQTYNRRTLSDKNNILSRKNRITYYTPVRQNLAEMLISVRKKPPTILQFNDAAKLWIRENSNKQKNVQEQTGTTLT